MPCHAAMTKNPITVSPDQTVEDVLALMKKSAADVVAVVGEDQVLQGMFSIQGLFKNALPVSVTMADGGQMDVSVHAAPGIAKRLKKVDPLPISELMERKVDVVYPETPTWEGVNFVVQHGAPLFVVEKDSHKFLGLITFQSALEELQRLKDS